LERLLLAPIDSEPRAQPAYAAVRDALTLEPVAEARPPLVFLVATRVGGIRLIDNVVIGDGLLDAPTWQPS
jgi:pantoate--beta-alanine ligase